MHIINDSARLRCRRLHLSELTLPFRHHLFFFFFSLFIYIVNILHAAGLHACNVAKANRDEDPMPKQLGPNRSWRYGFPISLYRIKSLLISDMLEASLPEPSVMVSSFIARYSPPKQCVLSIPPPSLSPSLVSNDKCTSHDRYPLSGKQTGQCLKILTGEQTDQRLNLCRHL